MTELVFPADFTWGAATAAYQIEGGWDADGKTPSVWDTLAHRGRLAGGATGDVACDHYHRWADDLELLAGLGVNGYRFSVSWPRVQPAGRGPFNPAGLDFYDRLVDGLLDRGIAPAVTLYHWDHPQAVEDAGGWTSRDTAYRFADYATGVADRLGDRVARWITLNEPLSVVTGHVLGFSRPAGPLGLAGLQVVHQLLLAHGLAVTALRSHGIAGEIGIAVDVHGTHPASDHPADRDAADRAEAYEDRLVLDPLLSGHYPQLDGRPLVDATPDELRIITAPIEFLGLNWYAPARIGHPWRHQQHRRRLEGAPTDLAGLLDGQAELFGYVRLPWPDAPTTATMNWPVLPDHLGATLGWLRDQYPDIPPLLITENGYPATEPATAGEVHDAARIDYLQRCLTQVHAAMQTGMDIRGYYVWSLLDNLEWGLGYGPRFGLVHVDFATLTRTPKASYHWYRQHIAAQRHAHRPRRPSVAIGSS